MHLLQVVNVGASLSTKDETLTHKPKAQKLHCVDMVKYS